MPQRACSCPIYLAKPGYRSEGSMAVADAERRLNRPAHNRQQFELGRVYQRLPNVCQVVPARLAQALSLDCRLAVRRHCLVFQRLPLINFIVIKWKRSFYFSLMNFNVRFSLWPFNWPDFKIKRIPRPTSFCCGTAKAFW